MCHGCQVMGNGLFGHIPVVIGNGVRVIGIEEHRVDSYGSGSKDLGHGNS